MECRTIKNVSFSNNWGARLYDLKFDINFNSSSVFQASFINEQGEYDITPDSLNAEQPNILNIGGFKVNVYPVSYKKQRSPGGRLLVVKYFDASHKYLDKVVVTAQHDSIQGERFLPLFPLRTRGGDDPESQSYAPKRLFEKMKAAGIPMSEEVKTVMESFDGEEGITKGVLLEETGDLRSVLASLGEKINQMFFWNWCAGGEEGILDVLSVEKSPEDAVELKEEMMETFGKEISSFDESYSIEDNHSDSDFVYKAEDTEVTAETGRSIRYEPLDIAINGVWLAPSESGTQTFNSNQLRSDNFLKMCAAAMVSEEVFERYIYWNLAASSANAQRRTGINFRGVPPGGYSTGAVTSSLVNQLVVESFEPLTDGNGIVFYMEPNKTFEELAEEAEGNNYPYIANIASWLHVLRDDDFEKVNKNSDSFWLMGIKTKEKFEENLERTYRVCRSYAENYLRYFIMSRVIERTSQGEIIEFSKIRHEFHRLLSIPTPWVGESQKVSQTFLSSLLDYVRWAVSEALGVQNPGQHDPQFEVFLNSLNITSSVGQELPEEQSDLDRMEGFAYLDLGENREFHVKEDIYMAEMKAPVRICEAFFNLAVHGYKVFAITRDGGYDASLTKAITPFKEVPDNKRVFYSVPAQRTLSYFDSEFDAQDQTDRFSVSNNFEIHEPPQGVLIGEWMSGLREFKWQETIGPNPSFALSVERVLEPNEDWLKRGVESLSISLAGDSGATTQIAIGSRKKQAQNSENIERILKESRKGQANVRVVHPEKPSAYKTSIYFGLKGFA